MNQFIYIGLALFIGLISTRLMKKIKLPNVTGFLLVGVLIGPFVLGPLVGGWNNNIDSPSYFKAIAWISDAALGFIAFSIGSSFSISNLKRVGNRVIVITLLEALGGAFVVLAGLFIFYAFNKSISPSVILTLGAIACATAPAATLMIIKQYRAKGKVVDTLLPVVALDDAVALISFAILFSLAKSLSAGTAISVIDVLVKPLVEILLSILIGGGMGLILIGGMKVFSSKSNRLTMIIAIILINVGLSKIIMNFGLFEVQISGLLTIMMVGAVFVNLFKENAKMFEAVDKFTPPLFMMFFILSGASLNLTIFTDKTTIGLLLTTAGIYVVARCIGKWSGAYIGASITHAEPEVKKYLGYTLSPQAGVAIGLATSASNYFGATSEVGKIILATVLTATIIYELVGPVITKIALTKAGNITNNK